MQNILIASLAPLWVKITDFGISKSWDGTGGLNTICGTPAYRAPELLGLLPYSMIPTGAMYNSSVDIWALGGIIHLLLTAEILFLTRDEPGGNSIFSTATEWTQTPQWSQNHDLLKKYCAGQVLFPLASLTFHGASEHAIDFVQSLMVPDPKKRTSATAALQHRWLANVVSSMDTAGLPTSNFPGLAAGRTPKRKAVSKQATSPRPPPQDVELLLIVRDGSGYTAHSTVGKPRATKVGHLEPPSPGDKAAPRRPRSQTSLTPSGDQPIPAPRTANVESHSGPLAVLDLERDNVVLRPNIRNVTSLIHQPHPYACLPIPSSIDSQIPVVTAAVQLTHTTERYGARSAAAGSSIDKGPGNSPQRIAPLATAVPNGSHITSSSSLQIHPSTAQPQPTIPTRDLIMNSPPPKQSRTATLTQFSWDALHAMNESNDHGQNSRVAPAPYIVPTPKVQSHDDGPNYNTPPESSTAPPNFPYRGDIDGQYSPVVPESYSSQTGVYDNHYDASNPYPPPELYFMRSLNQLSLDESRPFTPYLEPRGPILIL